jgi:hypothetical protein
VDLSNAQWFKSTRSGHSGCVEVAVTGGHVAVRDSKHPGGSILVFSSKAWMEFIEGIREGEFDLLPRNW